MAIPMRHDHPLQSLSSMWLRVMNGVWHWWRPTCTTNSDNTHRKRGTVPSVLRSHWTHSPTWSGWPHRCLVAGRFSNETSIVSSIWCDDFGTTSWSVPPSNSTISTIPFACWHSNIYLVWIRFQVSPIVWHCMLDVVCDRCPVCDNVSRTVLYLQNVWTCQFDGQWSTHER